MHNQHGVADRGVVLKVGTGKWEMGNEKCGNEKWCNINNVYRLYYSPRAFVDYSYSCILSIGGGKIHSTTCLKHTVYIGHAYNIAADT